MKIIIIMIIVTIVAVSVFAGISGNLNADQTAQTVVSPDSDPNRLLISISGEVTRPGSYSVEVGATLATVIEASGGTTANADTLTYFPDITVSKSIKYYIAPKYDNTDVCSMFPIEKVNVNSAAAEDLMKLNGVSSSLSQSIVSHRNSNGEFKYLEQVMDVSGIGNATYLKLRDYITLRDA